MPLGRHHKDATTGLQPSIFTVLLELLSSIKGRLTCICGTIDPLIPADHGLRVGNSFSRESGLRGRHFGGGRP